MPRQKGHRIQRFVTLTSRKLLHGRRALTTGHPDCTTSGCFGVESSVVGGRLGSEGPSSVQKGTREHELARNFVSVATILDQAQAALKMQCELLARREKTDIVVAFTLPRGNILQFAWRSARALHILFASVGRN